MIVGYLHAFNFSLNILKYRTCAKYFLINSLPNIGYFKVTLVQKLMKLLSISFLNMRDQNVHNPYSLISYYFWFDFCCFSFYYFYSFISFIIICEGLVILLSKNIFSIYINITMPLQKLSFVKV